MPIPDWFGLYLVGIILLQLLFFGYVIRRHGRSSEDRDADDPDATYIDCPRCDERNESDYEFCRSCVEELPGGYSRDGGIAGVMPGWSK